MKKILTAIILSSLLLTGCGSKSSSDSSSSSEKIEPTTVAETTEETNTEPILEFRMGETKDGELILTEKDVENASLQAMQNDDGLDYVIYLELTGSGREVFAIATSEAAENDQAISIWYKGEKICCPKVATAITDGNAMISGDFDYNKALEIANKIDPLSQKVNNDTNEGE